MPVLLVCLLIVALLLPGGAAWTVQAAPPAQEAPPDRLPYDGLFDLPRRAGVAPQGEAGQPLLAPEYVDWSRLVFQSARNNSDWEIYAARGDGANQVNISNQGSMDVHPRLNRGATRVVFASNRHGTYDLFTMNTDGDGQTRIVDSPTDDVFPAWSPDGSRITFQAYRDGQPEIYVANADGSGQTRLTNHGDYDGQPAWSPDGSQIAFVRRQSGEYRVWAMNADGSNQRPLSNQAYSADPAWSPDGSQIAYDADGNGDGWQEVWLMNADGSNQRQVYDPPEGNTDAWVGSWSPDGRYVAFTRISFVLYQGQWYWTSAYLDAWDSTQPWNTVRLSGNGADWNPSWESMDLQVPTSIMQPLPAESPAEFEVRWSGFDAGPSGIANFDVQLRVGATGAWTDWLMATPSGFASYRDTGGRTVYFRARARDNAGNVEAWPAGYDIRTTIESRPPVTAIAPLSGYSRDREVRVMWGGHDPGDSGIQYYDIQVLDSSTGDWEDWLTAVTYTDSTFMGDYGRTYRFRVRGTDRAQNVEAWPPGDGDTQTTIYRWAISGTVMDNGGAPVQGAAISTAPAATSAASSLADGAYVARVGTEAATYTVNASKAAYGSPPPTGFPGVEDARVALVLPPADNVVRNGAFETGALQPDWQVGGSLGTVVTTTLRHTGAWTALLGSPGEPFTAPVTLSTVPGLGSTVQMFPDGAGGVHLFWISSTSYPHASYAWRSQDGLWVFAPEGIPGPTRWESFAVSADGTAHAIGANRINSARSQILYTMRPPGGGWSDPVDLTSEMPDANAGGAQIALNEGNVVHVVWSDNRIYWTTKTASGVWSDPRDISGPILRQSAGAPLLAVDEVETVHVAWMDGDLTRYACRPSTSSWLPTRNIHDGYLALQALAVSPDGAAHVALRQLWQSDVWHMQGSCQGVWTAPERVGLHVMTVWPQLAVDPSGVAHLLGWSDYPPPTLLYARRPIGGSWSTPQPLVGQPTAGAMAVDHGGTAHVVWTGGLAGYPREIRVVYTRRALEPGWSAPSSMSTGTTGPGVAVEGNGRVHAAWLVFVNSRVDLRYATSTVAAQEGNATLTQTIAVPAASLNPGLAFTYHLGRMTAGGGSSFAVAVQSGSNTTPLFTTDQVTAGWTHRWLDLRPWAGQSIALVFTLHQAAGELAPWVYMDDVSVGSTRPDLWIAGQGTSARPDEPAIFTIVYGNRGAAPGANARVTASLPAGLVFVSAAPPPTSTGVQLTWNVGNLAGKSGPFTIRVTARADPPVGLGTVAGTASVASQSPELEMHNNSAQATAFVGHFRYMPVIMR
jgi:uncharacterized repeat protein (TIGR01451 family)